MKLCHAVSCQGTIPFNSFPLNGAGITLYDSNGYPGGVLEGIYSIFLHGADQFTPPPYQVGVSIFQTGTIPATASSLLYLGNGCVQVSFNGQSLSRVALGNGRWGIDISAYAGQTGQLGFGVPYLCYSALDDIQFSPSTIPEPSVLALFALATALLSSRLLRGSLARQ